MNSNRRIKSILTGLSSSRHYRVRVRDLEFDWTEMVVVQDQERLDYIITRYRVKIGDVTS